jgi:peptide/nickel transport system ATP-binding protein
VGESGSGKSVTSLAVMGLLPADARVTGSVRYRGAELLDRRDRDMAGIRGKGISMIFQDPMTSLDPVYRVGHQIEETLRIHDKNLSGRAATSRAVELLEMVGIAQAADRVRSYPHEFSGGMRQRAAIAMALACAPKVLLADEPTTALDVMVQAQIMQLLVQLTAELGLALVLVTHDLPVVAQVCTRAAVMYAGEIVEQGPMRALYHDPRHPYTRMLFAATPDPYGDHGVESIPGVPPRLDRELLGCPFAPRCDRAFDRCRVEAPLSRRVAAEHLAACHLADRVERAARA